MDLPSPPLPSLPSDNRLFSRFQRPNWTKSGSKNTRNSSEECASEAGNNAQRWFAPHLCSNSLRRWRGRAEEGRGKQTPNTRKQSFSSADRLSRCPHFPGSSGDRLIRWARFPGKTWYLEFCDNKVAERWREVCDWLGRWVAFSREGLSRGQCNAGLFLVVCSVVPVWLLLRFLCFQLSWCFYFKIFPQVLLFSVCVSSFHVDGNRVLKWAPGGDKWVTKGKDKTHVGGKLPCAPLGTCSCHAQHFPAFDILCVYVFCTLHVQTHAWVWSFSPMHQEACVWRPQWKDKRTSISTTEQSVIHVF